MSVNSLPEMRHAIKKTLRDARRMLRLSYRRLSGNQLCFACGFRGQFVTRKALWPELLAQWELSSEWSRWFDLREGQACPRCWSNLRSIQLAQAIVSAVKNLCGASGMFLNDIFDDEKARGLRIAEINSVGTLHQFLVKCPNLFYSEYGSKSEGVPSENLLDLSYADNTFNLVVTSETLEHVPDVDVALREIYRVLKPNGLHVFTVPIVRDQKNTRQRARLENGELLHLLPPSYHGGAQREKSDYLVFYEFGDDFIGRCEKAGFQVDILSDDKNPALIALTARRTVVQFEKPTPRLQQNKLNP